MLLRPITAAAFSAWCALALSGTVRADQATALSAALVAPANAALRPRDPSVAQAAPVGAEQAPLATPGLPRGLSYTLDLSSAYPLNATGKSNVRLPGGLDAVLGYGFGRHFRIQAGYYQFQEYPTGFDGGSVPLYLQGLSAPIGVANLGAAQQDVTIKNEIFVANFQTLVQLGRVPIVITPSYVARRGQIGGHSDETLVEIGDFPQTVRLRTFEQQLIAFTLPFLSTPRFFGTYTIAPQWLVNTNGANRDNHAQLFQLAYLEYRATKSTTLFVQPSILQNYTPADAYSNHIPTLIYGFSQRTSKYTFIQFLGSTGAATNPIDRERIGIVDVTCQRLPCNAPGTLAPRIGGLHASQVQLQFGVGTPSVVPL
ncbi:MAG: hypothetical protein GIX03_09725 [Candidatus Eremiobacteraeota bacterium]|nr:hypothetical protein [Candidatus Eremiobacteraeota bacterium]MBC5803249.1 hypothetical protein [Candidatus Eremiobacteraeota bacterium]MBC5822270.1 hypothetical protein [Candidatus Eremiobacteraeota bacterium]